MPAGTTADWITAATALINSYCRRPDLNVIQYTERLRLTGGAQTVLLSYLPLSPLGPATTPLVSIEGRYARPRRGERANEPLTEIALAFSLPSQWAAIDPGSGSAVLPAYIVTEDLIEYHWLGDPTPRIFQLGLPNSMTHQYVAVKFGAPVVKGAGFAHCQVTVTGR